MVRRNCIRFLAALLAVVLLAAPVSADAGQRLAVEREVFDYLTRELKLSTAAACGVLANIEHESNFQPTIYGDQGTSYGLCQWHDGRFSALRGFCSALGMDYRTTQGQLAYLRYELGTHYTTLLLTLQSLENTPEGAYRAAYLWCVQFERPSNMTVKAAARGELARGKYWARYSSYNSIVLAPEAPQPEPEELIEQLTQNPVTIPLPPEAPEERTMRYVFQKPALIFYIPHHLPQQPQKEAAAPQADTGWCIPALAGIFAAMAAVVLFPTKKGASSLYRRGKDMVK